MFGLCFSTAVQRVNRSMLCKAGSSRQVSIGAVPVAAKPGLVTPGISQPLCLAVRTPYHQGPNHRFNTDRLRRPR